MATQIYLRRCFTKKTAFAGLGVYDSSSIEIFTAAMIKPAAQTDPLNFLFQEDSISVDIHGWSNGQNRSVRLGSPLSPATRVLQIFSEKVSKLCRGGDKVINSQSYPQTKMRFLKAAILSILTTVNDTACMENQQDFVYRLLKEINTLFCHSKKNDRCSEPYVCRLLDAG